jgi:membrane protein YdbS with pleckstrin-like domain
VTLNFYLERWNSVSYLHDNLVLLLHVVKWTSGLWLFGPEDPWSVDGFLVVVVLIRAFDLDAARTMLMHLSQLMRINLRKRLRVRKGLLIN